MNSDTLGKYVHAFGNLHRYKGVAPHKPVLLLSVLDEIERGHITDNQIILSVELAAAFRENWSILPLPPGNWQERVWVPFRYLIQDGFWDLVKDGEVLSGKQVGDPHSIADLRSRVNYARFAPDLWQLLQDGTARKALRAHLLQTCFNISPAQVQPVIPADPLAAQLNKLIAESKSQPRPKTFKPIKDDTFYFVRNGLFSRVVYALYNHSCAVCGLNVRTDTRSVLEASHIKPFADYHDDDPSNGITMCRNHHWTFDGGGFSIADDYTLLVSPRLQNAAGFVTPGATLRLPSSARCNPAPESLAWHRDNVYKK